jgi:CheY-like chemotaxis protein
MTKSNSDRPRVLLVDDYPDAREMYSEYLQFSGFDVIEAANGMEALQRAADEAPDIILMDLSLPVMDGWEATRRLKSDPRTAEIPVVALTGHEALPPGGSGQGNSQGAGGALGTEGPQERAVCENLKLARAPPSGARTRWSRPAPNRGRRRQSGQKQLQRPRARCRRRVMGRPATEPPGATAHARPAGLVHGRTRHLRPFHGALPRLP